MNAIQEFVNSYKIEKISLMDQYIQNVKNLAKINIDEAKVLAVESKLNSALKSLPILVKVSKSHSINKLSDLERFGIFSAIQGIDMLAIKYLDDQLKGII